MQNKLFAIWVLAAQLIGPLRGPRIGMTHTPYATQVFDLRAAGLPQFKAAGLVVVSDHNSPTFYRVIR